MGVGSEIQGGGWLGKGDGLADDTGMGDRKVKWLESFKAAPHWASHASFGFAGWEIFYSL